MLLRLFKGTGPGVIILVLITLILMWIDALLKPGMMTAAGYNAQPMPLYGILKAIIGSHQWLGVAVSFLMVSLLAILMVVFNTSVFFINERTFLPALFYILFASLFPEYHVLNPVLPAALFLLLAIIRIMDGYHISGTAYNYFDAGLLLSAGSFFYADLIWFGPLIIIGIPLLRTATPREILLAVVGLIAPYLITFGLYYVTGKGLGTLWELIKYNLFNHSEAHHLSALVIVTLILTGFLLLLSLSSLVQSINSKKIKSRKTFSLLIWVLLISAITYFLSPSVSDEMLILTAIPLSYFLSNYFVFARKKLIPEVLFTLLFLLIMVLQFVNQG